MRSIDLFCEGGYENLLWHYRERKRVLKINNRLQKKPVEIQYKEIQIEKSTWDGKNRLMFPKIPDNPQISIVIPIFNNFKFTYQCLDSILKKTPSNYEIIIVDDCSSDDTVQYFSQAENIRIIKNTENLGFIRSCNKGIEISRGEYILFLNNDTQVTENWLDPLLCIIQKDDVGAVGCKLVFPNGKLQEAGGIVWKDASALNYGREDDPNKPEYNFIREVDYCSGAVLLVKRDLVAEIGGLDEIFLPAYYEDTSLCFSIREKGYKVMYQPKTVVIHHEGITSGTNLSSGIKKYQNINKEKFREKWRNVLERDHLLPEDNNIFNARARGKSKNILIIDNYLPMYDKDSGSLRMYNLIKIFNANGYHITFIGDNLGYIEPYASTLQQEGIEVICTSNIQSTENYLSQFGAFFNVAILSKPQNGEKYLSLMKKFCSNAKIIYDTVDLHYLRESRRADIENNNDLKKYAKYLKNLEFHLMKNCDVTWVVSDIEKKELLKEDPSLCIQIISNIHQIQPYIAPFENRKDIMFIGGFYHQPNVDAVVWFVKDIFPLIEKEIPDIKFYIVGNAPPIEVQTLSSHNIFVTGYSEDVSPYFQHCRLSVAPLRYGAGVKGKINQSMSFGLPVVTTPIGAEGMSLVDGKDIIIAETPQEFCNKLKKVYHDKELWDTISNNSIENVKQYFSYETWQQKIKFHIEEICDYKSIEL